MRQRLISNKWENPRCSERETGAPSILASIWQRTQLRTNGIIKRVVCSHLRPLSPPKRALAAPWLMNRPPHRNAGSSGFPFTGSAKPSTTVSAPRMTALTNAPFTWTKRDKSANEVIIVWCKSCYVRPVLLGYLEQSPVPLKPFLHAALWKISGSLQLLIPVWSLHRHYAQLHIIIPANSTLLSKYRYHK